MLVVGIDPSMTCTGYAVLSGSCVLDAGVIRPSGKTLTERAHDLWRHCRDIVTTHRGAVVVVELPAARGIPPDAQGFRRRSALTLPVYGIAVGIVLGAYWASPGARLIAVAADAWTRGMPSTRGDPRKTGRVRLVEQLYGLGRGGLGAPTVAGNVADAVLLARYAERRAWKETSDATR